MNSQFDLGAVDFDAVYSGSGPLVGDVSFDRPPWDIGEPQPALVRCVEAGGVTGEVLDVGCGAGENAIYLAERGYSVTAVDGSPKAIELASGRAAARGAEVRFLVADATRLDVLDQRFDTVLDSALYHCLPEESRVAYAEALHRVTNPGARLQLFCFADTVPKVIPFAVSQENLRANLGTRWDITDITLDHYSGAFPEGTARQMLGRLGGDPEAAVDTDSQGRLAIPVWHLRAVRAD